MAPLLFQFLARLGKVTGGLALKVPPTVIVALFYKFPVAFFKFAAVNGHDFGLFLGNMLTPQLKKGSVVKEGVPGHGGIWPPFVAPTEGDSRSPCPYLNAMANHGILPHDGKNIDLDKLCDLMVACFNFSPTLAKDTTNSVGNMYGKKSIDLGYLSAPNVIEHDASLVRHDHCWVPDQVPPANDLIHDMLASATGPVTPDHPEGRLTPADLSRCLSLREAKSKRDNPVFSLDFLHRFFGASNASLMYEVCEGDVQTLKTVLYEERLPDGFESSLRQRFGYTMQEFHLRSLEIYLGRKEVKLPEGDMTTQEAIKRAAAEEGRKVHVD